MTEVRIEHASGAVDYVAHIEDKTEHEVDEQSVARIRTYREDAQTAGLELNDDDVYIVEGGMDIFGGVLTNTVSHGKQTELVVKSFQEHAKYAEPTKAKLTYENANDRTIVRDAIAGIPELSAGTIESIEPGIDIVFHHATRALQLRLMRQLSKAHVVYNADKTVDYTSSLGSDKMGTTISPQNQNLTQSRAKDDGGDQVYTHLRVVGGGGASVDVVAGSYDPATDDERWGRAAFKEVSDPELLVRYGEALLSELSTPWLEVEATVTDLDPSLGDTYHVSYPEEAIDDNLAVTKIRTTRDTTGTHHELWLSNRSFARNKPAKQLEARVEEAVRTGQTSNTKNVPSINFPMTELPPESYIDQNLLLHPKETLHVWSMWCSPLRKNVTVKVIEGSGSAETVVAELPDDETQISGSPLASFDIGDNYRNISFRLENESASLTHATSAMFAYTVERVQR